ncbi:MAG: Pre-mRNA-splicing factor cwc26 [Alectoria fallacina]|uniref:Pre-mRNA-splicing factor cwc26 n=1 Tax=Alectoria fallacina TaxID=1903189 RepID=A0A8H3FH94_9LECA|nr:MAG: Pre-mRNA-splicing factor cwc26 [Alectoria fallacina]
MSLADYLAKNYLTADSKPEKISKKRKQKEFSALGLTIADDDALGWDRDGTGNTDDDAPLEVNANSSEFRKARKNIWQTIGVPTPSSNEQAAADAILTSAAAESQARALADDDAPSMEDSAMKMESGAHAGLQTADQVTAQLKRKETEERRRFLEDGDDHSGKGKETIYRDASGRIINVQMKRAEARKKAEEAAAKAAAELEIQKGDVQRAEKHKRREQLSEAKLMPVARYADDVELNEDLKERERWNDPAVGFIKKKKEGESVSGKPLYKGPAAPNRYGIRPGHRWDGVDRGTGFEKDYFAARNRRANLKNLDYAWQMDE